MITEYKIKNYHALFDKAYSEYKIKPKGVLEFKESNYEKKVGIFFEKDICYVFKDGYDIIEFNRSRDKYNHILYLKEPRLYVFFTKTDDTQATEQNACVYSKKEGVLAQTNNATIVYNEGKVLYIFMPSCLADLSSECGKIYFDEEASKQLEMLPFNDKSLANCDKMSITRLVSRRDKFIERTAEELAYLSDYKDNCTNDKSFDTSIAKVDLRYDSLRVYRGGINRLFKDNPKEERLLYKKHTVGTFGTAGISIKKKFWTIVDSTEKLNEGFGINTEDILYRYCRLSGYHMIFMDGKGGHYCVVDRRKGVVRRGFEYCQVYGCDIFANGMLCYGAKPVMFDSQARYFWRIFMRDLWYEDLVSEYDDEYADEGMPELFREIDTAVSVNAEFGWTFDKMHYTDDVFKEYKKIMQTYHI